MYRAVLISNVYSKRVVNSSCTLQDGVLCVRPSHSSILPLKSRTGSLKQHPMHVVVILQKVLHKTVHLELSKPCPQVCSYPQVPQHAMDTGISKKSFSVRNCPPHLSFMLTPLINER